MDHPALDCRRRRWPELISETGLVGAGASGHPRAATGNMGSSRPQSHCSDIENLRKEIRGGRGPLEGISIDPEIKWAARKSSGPILIVHYLRTELCPEWFR